MIKKIIPHPLQFIMKIKLFIQPDPDNSILDLNPVIVVFKVCRSVEITPFLNLNFLM